MICLRAMTGKLTPAKTQGQKLSILLARASSRAPAECGLANRWRSSDELTCAPWLMMACAAWSGTVSRREGERSGEEKESRYSAMKKASLRAQATKRTVCGRGGVVGQ